MGSSQNIVEYSNIFFSLDLVKLAGTMWSLDSIEQFRMANSEEMPVSESLQKRNCMCERPNEIMLI